MVQRAVRVRTSEVGEEDGDAERDLLRRDRRAALAQQGVRRLAIDAALALTEEKGVERAADEDDVARLRDGERAVPHEADDVDVAGEQAEDGGDGDAVTERDIHEARWLPRCLRRCDGAGCKVSLMQNRKKN